ncbi:hypothetical protein T492DRAFT_947127 [Pavlovales sp. CCMP2436]|nr:hypothetical protein T492DRAFT_947127 [Pavlovales sp. CCMP2436]|mmetsp:Transcript_22883/g.53098  ORF Transcript_22883/g.53098 Transcript_22883/m.53098 type:complete len:239 (-) Transcript_22883:76-792(-)
MASSFLRRPALSSALLRPGGWTRAASLAHVSLARALLAPGILALSRRLSSAHKGSEAVLRVPQVRLIGADGTNRGVIDSTAALESARAEGMHLVEANGKAVPPVWRLSAEKPSAAQSTAPPPKAAEGAKGKSGVPDAKQLRLTLGVAENDLQTKIRQMGKFLEKQLRVRITIRKASRATVGIDADALMERIATDLQHLGPTRKVMRKDPNGKPLEVDFIPAAAGAAARAVPAVPAARH